MKVFFAATICAIILPLNVYAYTSPGKPTGYVNDFAHILNTTDAQSMDAKLKSLEQSTGAQGAVVTVNSLGDETIEIYAVKLFEEWGIGNKKDDNGFLILVAPTEHEVKIEVGYGLEGMLTDLQSGNIIDQVMVPAFKNGDYDGGISGAVDAVSSIVTNSPDAAIFSKPRPSTGGLDINAGAIFFAFFVVVNILSRILGATKSWWLGGVIGAIAGGVIGFVWGFFFAGIIAIPVLTILGLIFDYIVSNRPPGSGGFGGGFWPIFLGGGRGGSGGGFGGFGGGSSGGGGASGRW